LFLEEKIKLVLVLAEEPRWKATTISLGVLTEHQNVIRLTIYTNGPAVKKCDC
jgi:hypothetical protein